MELIFKFKERKKESKQYIVIILPLIQEGKLSVTCERMCTEYWLTA